MVRAVRPSASSIAYPPIAVAAAGRRGVKWIDNFGVQILIYVMLGWGLNIVVGLAGLLDLGYVAFYAVGAYSYALLATDSGCHSGLLPLAGILAAFWGMMLGFPVLRLRGDYLAIVTLAFGEIIRLVLINWVALTNGYAGITVFPRPTFFGIPFNADREGFAAVFGLPFSPLHRVIFLYLRHPGAGAPHRFRHLRLRRLPSAAPGKRCARTRSPAARSASTPPTPNSRPSRMGAIFAGFAGFVLRHAAGLHLAGVFTFLESATDPRHRRARRHGQPDRRRHRRDRHDRRHRAARARFP